MLSEDREHWFVCL